MPRTAGPRADARMVQASAEIRATRKTLRALRRAIPRDRRLAAERAIVRHLKQLHVFRPGAKVAVGVDPTLTTGQA